MWNIQEIYYQHLKLKCDIIEYIYIYIYWTISICKTESNVKLVLQTTRCFAAAVEGLQKSTKSYVGYDQRDREEYSHTLFPLKVLEVFDGPKKKNNTNKYQGIRKTNEFIREIGRRYSQ